MQLSLRRKPTTANKDIAPAGTDSTSLLVRVRTGDSEATEQLIQAHVERISAIVGAILGPAHPDVPDAVQETFLRALDRLGQCRSDAAFPVWLTRIAQNVCRNQRKSAWERRITPRAASELPEPAEAPPDWAAAMDLRAALEQLREDERVFLVLHFVHGYTCEELGEMFGQGPEAVRSRMRRAQARLRKRLGPQWEGSDENE